MADENMMQSPEERDAFTVEEFCRRNAISKSTLYEMWSDGVGPAVMKRGGWVRISREAAAEWRRSLSSKPGQPTGDRPQEAA